MWRGTWDGVWDGAWEGEESPSGVLNTGLVVVGTGTALFGAELQGGQTAMPAGVGEGAAKRKRRYVVEWKGENYGFDTLSEAESFIALAQAEMAVIAKAIKQAHKRPKDAVRWDLEPDVPDMPARPALRRVRAPVYVAPPKQVVDAMMRRVMDDEEEELLLMLIEAL